MWATSTVSIMGNTCAFSRRGLASARPQSSKASRNHGHNSAAVPNSIRRSSMLMSEEM